MTTRPEVAATVPLINVLRFICRGFDKTWHFRQDNNKEPEVKINGIGKFSANLQSYKNVRFVGHNSLSLRISNSVKIRYASQTPAIGSHSYRTFLSSIHIKG
jgi:hypothetical protein